MRLPLALIIAAAPLSAQLQLSIFNAAQQETVIANTVDFGTTAAGAYVEFRLRIRNLSASSIAVDILRVPPGTAFSLINPPDLPRDLRPNSFADFTLRFAPASVNGFTGQLLINAAVYELRGQGSGYVSLQRSVNGSWQELPSGTTVDLGVVPASTSQAFDFRISNLTSVPLTAAAFSLSGGGGTLTGMSGGAITLQAGQTVAFSLTIQFAQSGPLNLTLASGTRVWPIRVTIAAAAIPQPKLTVSSLTSGQETPIGLKLDSAPQATIDGVMTVDFTPAAGLADDRAVTFLPSGLRSVAFHLTSGSTTVSFAGASSVSLQTGTTAGTVNFTLKAGTQTWTQSIPIAPEAASIESMGGSVSDTVLDIDLLGFDNSRTLSRLSFNFSLKDGTRLAQGPIDVDVSAMFRQYYQQYPSAAGAFRLGVHFQVSGTASLFKGVDITLTNSVAPVVQQIIF